MSPIKLLYIINELLDGTVPRRLVQIVAEAVTKTQPLRNMVFVPK